MTRDAINSFELLRARLKAHLESVPEYRALQAIETSIRAIQGLDSLKIEDSRGQQRVESAPGVETGGRAEPGRLEPNAASKRDGGPMALGIARGLEGSLASVRQLRAGDQ